MVLGLFKSFMDAEAKQKALELAATIDVAYSDADGLTPLMLSASAAKLDIMNRLVKRGADVNHRNREGNTVLHRAAIHGDARVVRWAVEASALLDLQNEEGWTPVDYAVLHGQK